MKHLFFILILDEYLFFRFFFVIGRVTGSLNLAGGGEKKEDPLSLPLSLSESHSPSDDAIRTF